MRFASAAIAGFCTLPLLTGTALAQNEERYRLERTENGYVRMDTETGTMTLCQERGGELVCRPATDESAAAVETDDAQTLRERIDALEARVKALEGERAGALPGEQEFEQSLNMMERFFRRFVDIVRGLEQEETPGDQSPNQHTAPPQRT
ncbi:hypothetical protein [Chelativorans sp. J32]|uniref:hypothetical protein n=1 Tax=Chelativorans sp. J32 TaxID=935840 RepID=UPI0004866148|nr:hypothetical protein [Chelativorans sp. J32]